MDVIIQKAVQAVPQRLVRVLASTIDGGVVDTELDYYQDAYVRVGGGMLNRVVHYYLDNVIKVEREAFEYIAEQQDIEGYIFELVVNLIPDEIVASMSLLLVGSNEEELTNAAIEAGIDREFAHGLFMRALAIA